jgi:hypothetical protein
MRANVSVIYRQSITLQFTHLLGFCKSESFENNADEEPLLMQIICFAKILRIFQKLCANEAASHLVSMLMEMLVAVLHFERLGGRTHEQTLLPTKHNWHSSGSSWQICSPKLKGVLAGFSSNSFCHLKLLNHSRYTIPSYLVIWFRLAH